MPEIYMYGACTISASRASTSEEGFLQGHAVDDIHHEPISLHVNLPNGVTGSVNLSNPGSEYRYEKEPIHKRAWCYQERILSPRIIDFGHTQIQWICKSKRHADGGRADRAATTDALIIGTLNGLSQRELLNAWSNVVWKYTRRDITFAGDKLLAISAVAAYYAPLIACDYVAGHWRDMLALQLAWIVGQPKYPPPSVYVAPSWSWASVSDSVYWDMLDERVPAIEILDCQVQLSRPSAPFGVVREGVVKLRGQICEMTWYFNRDNKQVQVEAGNISFMADRATAEELPGYKSTLFQGWVDRDALRPDWSQHVDASMEVSCLKLRERSQKGDTLCIFLIPALETPGAFRRIASFRMVDALYRYDPPLKIGVFSDCPWRDILII
ncbi:hypothetical protein IQ06DRAFT_118132 [Phaeosphaeriaceae sp. SRC1lsM3a]|nr:hypothetical protein IQ06DRAFT_118132 [Stagonospora sp. SRC1lsM3a]